MPIVYAGDWDVAEPLYGLRRMVISVGTISSYQDRLFCADLTVITSGYDRWWTESDDPCYFYDHELNNPDIVSWQRFQYRLL